MEQPSISIWGRLRQEDCEFEPSLGKFSESPISVEALGSVPSTNTPQYTIHAHRYTHTKGKMPQKRMKDLGRRDRAHWEVRRPTEKCCHRRAGQGLPLTPTERCDIQRVFTRQKAIAICTAEGEWDLPGLSFLPTIAEEDIYRGGEF